MAKTVDAIIYLKEKIYLYRNLAENLNIDSECAIIASLEAYELNSEDFS